ncbi:FliM/FliN family flagellar motor switch protein [Hyphococcus flavus]|uniref:Flagellar motor switch protein FliN n=1 Tax=Hyphococcus flavus TaxID=1866326 RepID=A0AAE9ZEV2_9PROT|nr:FliM/FliN family flagellar motor switch protein [Hyphococcus flavus]WDI31533.1 FliM/FliN family flagellar motor switch protein [Hyphococcus flavus]
MSDTNEIVAEDDVVEAVADEGALRNKNILGLPVRIVVSVGGAQVSVKDLLDLKQDTVIDLDAAIDDPVDIYVGDRLVARGELVEATDNENGIGVKLLEVCGFGD